VKSNHQHATLRDFSAAGETGAKGRLQIASIVFGGMEKQPASDRR